MIEVQLKRAFTPEEVGAQVPCGVCGTQFITGRVLACILEVEDGAVCRWCLSDLNQRNPEQFPSAEELLDAVSRYPEPVYGSVEEVIYLERTDEHRVRVAYEESWLTRA